jgi:hypothetical protein
VPVLHELTSWAIQHKVDLASLSVSRQSLEDIYLKLAGRRAAAPVKEAAE